MSQLSTKLPWELAQTKWAATLNPIIAIPFLSGNIITGVDLVANKPKAVNHLLQKIPRGWFLIDNTANANIWRAGDSTKNFITLESSADTTISFWVF